MSKDNVIALSQPGTFTDLLSEVLRNGARALLAKAVEAEAADFLERYAALMTADGRQRLVRHGQSARACGDDGDRRRARAPAARARPGARRSFI